MIAAAAAIDFIAQRHSMSRVKWLVAIVAAIYVAIIVSHISYVAGGPDESGYMNEARMLASGRTHIDITPLRTLHLDDSWAIVFTPLGFSPRGHEMVPVYPAGYPILFIFGRFFVVALAAFAAIALTYFIACELGLSFWYAVSAAAILAADATFVLHSIVVMSDVVATFWALLAILLALRAAPHPPFGHLLPASGEKGLARDSSLAPRSGERVAEGRVRGALAYRSEEHTSELHAALPIYPPSGPLPPASGEKGLARDSSLAPRSGERVAEGRVRGALAYAAGAAFAIGVWVRPTNILVAIPVLIVLRSKIVKAVIAAIPFGIALMLFNAKVYGSPFATGYGSAAVFTWGDCFWEQLRYLMHIVSPAVVIGGLLIVLDKKAPRALLFAWFAAFIVFYGCWQVCDNWTLTRFLLPATPALIIAAVFLVRDIPWPRAVAAIVILGILGYSVDKWHKRHILDVPNDQLIYSRSVRVAQQLVPRDAMLVTGLLSGTFFNYDNERFTVRWDTLEADRFAALRARTNAKWYAALSEVEVPMTEFRRRLPGR